ncbi:MAG: hypothetical protein KGL62_04110 [Bradyrhizobium sp.]|uniref:hypothetical protein n=1 Tax=Bradyrhizobium sp. TaxID=376 RepID=UPI00239EEBAF|nr:hypothetical protein [Bradyrhizobium sp.]MDE2601538.1 hypothetical protein [Bradyrhizobium sp.]
MAAIAVIRDGGPGLSTGAAPELRRFSFVSSSPFDDVELRRRNRSLDPGPRALMAIVLLNSGSAAFAQQALERNA